MIVGVWDEVTETSDEQLHYLFNNDKVGAFYVTDANDEVKSSMTFYWSANENTLILRSLGEQRNVPYTVSASTLVLGTGDESVVYSRHLGIGE